MDDFRNGRGGEHRERRGAILKIFLHNARMRSDPLTKIIAIE